MALCQGHGPHIGECRLDAMSHRGTLVAISETSYNARRIIKAWGGRFDQNQRGWKIHTKKIANMSDRERTAFTLMLFRLREMGCEVKIL